MINWCRIICLKKHHGATAGKEHIKSDRILAVTEAETCFPTKSNGMAGHSLGRNSLPHTVALTLRHCGSYIASAPHPPRTEEGSSTVPVYQCIKSRVGRLSL